MQFAQAAAQLPEDFFEDLMVGQEGFPPAVAGAMPGGMPGMEPAFGAADFADEDNGQGILDGRPGVNNDAVELRENDGPGREDVDDEIDEDDDEEEEDVPVSCHTFVTTPRR